MPSFLETGVLDNRSSDVGAVFWETFCASRGELVVEELLLQSSRGAIKYKYVKRTSFVEIGDFPTGYKVDQPSSGMGPA